jgi:hypothetical protein
LATYLTEYKNNNLPYNSNDSTNICDNINIHIGNCSIHGISKASYNPYLSIEFHYSFIFRLYIFDPR